MGSWKQRVTDWLVEEKIEISGELVNHFQDGQALVLLLQNLRVPMVRIDTRDMVAYKFFLIAQRMLYSIGIRFTLADTKAIMNLDEATLMKVLIRIFYHAKPT